jgi:hypothetical protein
LAERTTINVTANATAQAITIGHMARECSQPERLDAAARIRAPRRLVPLPFFRTALVT